MRSMKVLALAAVLGLTLSACEGYKYVGTNVCNKDGASVWYIKPNSQGKIDTADVSDKNCYSNVK